MKKRISILGCGWLGLPLAEKLIAEGYDVNGSTTTTVKQKLLLQKGVTPFLINTEDLNKQSFLEFLQANTLIITMTPQSKKRYNKLIDVIEQSPVKQILFVSSTAVYPANNGVVQEKDAVYMKSVHSGKVMLELEELFTKNDNFETTVIRFCGLFGPSRIPGRFMSGFRDLKGGDNPVNMIHLEDCIQILWRVIDRDVWGDIFNACSDNHPTRKEFYETAAKSAGLVPPQFSNRNEPDKYRIVSSKKLKEKLDYTFIHPNPLKALK
jgi:nucleoside-diphosphate-sugar epimerase